MVGLINGHVCKKISPANGDPQSIAGNAEDEEEEADTGTFSVRQRVSDPHDKVVALTIPLYRLSLLFVGSLVAWRSRPMLVYLRDGSARVICWKQFATQ